MTVGIPLVKLNAGVAIQEAPAESKIKKIPSNLSVALFPNPSHDYGFLDLGKNDAAATVELFDMQGRLMSSLKNSEVLLKWDASFLTNGLYPFRIQKRQQLELQKWVKN